MSDRLAELDGRELSRDLDLEADVVIVGSGPAGAAVARVTARGGAKVIVLEEGPELDGPAPDGFSAMTRFYRDMGTSVLMGRAPIPFLQGRVLGGTSVVNGAISWRLPRDVFEEWVRADPRLGESLRYEEIESRTETIEAELGIAPTPPAVAGAKNLLVAAAAEKLGWSHRPIARNVIGCKASGRCLEVCPNGAKSSMDRTYLRDAKGSGARIYTSLEVRRIEHERGVARGVVATTQHGTKVRVGARRAVVLAASAVGSPALLMRSGLGGPLVGHGFQCHPGVSMAARFPHSVTAWVGATQGHEVIAFRKEGIKIEVLGYDPSILLLRTKGVGRALARDAEELDRFINLGAAVRAEAVGRVSLGLFGGTRVSYALTDRDLAKIRRGLRLMGELLLEAGASEVLPGVFGFDERITERSRLSTLESEGPRDPRAYALAVTHMFATARMGSDPSRSVVRPDFRHHQLDRLYVADSSVFPSNTGVNPQTSILALATLCGESVLGDLRSSPSREPRTQGDEACDAKPDQDPRIDP